MNKSEIIEKLKKKYFEVLDGEEKTKIDMLLNEVLFLAEEEGKEYFNKYAECDRELEKYKNILASLQEKIEEAVEELYIGDITDDGRKELKEEIQKIFKGANSQKSKVIQGESSKNSEGALITADVEPEDVNSLHTGVSGSSNQEICKDCGKTKKEHFEGDFCYPLTNEYPYNEKSKEKFQPKQADVQGGKKSTSGSSTPDEEIKWIRKLIIELNKRIRYLETEK